MSTLGLQLYDYDQNSSPRIVLHQQKIWDHHQVDARGNGRSHLSPFAAIYSKYGL